MFITEERVREIVREELNAPRHNTQEAKMLVLKAIEAGKKTQPEIAEHAGGRVNWVTKVVQYHGLETPYTQRPHISNAKRNLIIQDIMLGENSLNEIANHYNVSRSYVDKCKKEAY